MKCGAMVSSPMSTSIIIWLSLMIFNIENKENIVIMLDSFVGVESHSIC